MRTEGGTAVEWLLYAATYLWLGVPLFFVISGYCIAASADSARRITASFPMVAIPVTTGATIPG